MQGVVAKQLMVAEIRTMTRADNNYSIKPLYYTQKP